ncbi:NAD-dependent protein deacetylase, SIR2 family [Methanobrevibacter sp. 87.7]|uniref:Sir2 family NAD-dependent protein deacetylase n=1 Tax=Methanobrevibacter sp. 87.7 TaxID=387957 RepID=UPI000B5090E5|nr:Sir2 family NAD-dependent protein deacetylase [Methanobrevibacter sp. 87.7]OWT32917.1 NAD-dependent protein deacetylase, SIR2 family [Methanobrevibacter sp. 87.7]
MFNNYSKKIKKAYDKISEADNIVVGVGSGLSAAGGVNYADEKFFKEHYPQYAKLGYHNVSEVMGVFWTFLNKDNACKYWGFWSHHINEVRYKTPALKPYISLYNILKDKNYYIISTNVDYQLEKAGFKQEKIFEPQGQYSQFQCIVPCSNDVYYNEKYIKSMIKNKVDDYTISSDDIPYCPKCGEFLIQNLRCDNKFVEGENYKNYNKYKEFLKDSVDKNTVFLELGVGYNTPTIIRFPFEQYCHVYPNSTLIRMNLNQASIPEGINNGISIDNDLNQSLKDMLDLI